MPCEPLRAFGAEFVNDVRTCDNGGTRRQLKMEVQQHYVYGAGKAGSERRRVSPQG